MECHGEEDNTGEIDGEEVSIFIDLNDYQNSVHESLSCIDCHDEIEELPHQEGLSKVDCSNCHDDVLEIFSASVHGIAALQREDKFAPTCASCHGKHNILPPSDPSSKTYIMNIPATCGTCHKEGTEMTETHEIDQHNVVSNYSMSIHGEGLFRRGLIVTAVCTSCHGSHNILHHANPQSSINKDNVTTTCMTCHAQIEVVHEKIIEGQLWEKEPHKIPICVDCHSPHKIQRVQYDIEIADGTCLTCHSDQNLKMEKDGEEIALFIDKGHVDNSVHANVSCVKCHYDVHPENDPVCKDIKPVDCSVCHAKQVSDHQTSIHGAFEALGDPNAPTCLFCHGTHDMLPKDNPQSVTFPKNVPKLCSQCHAHGQPAAIREAITEDQIVSNYSMSVHGKGLIESGLVVTAMCTNCHNAHNILAPKDENSSVNEKNIGKTCGKCHFGILEEFDKSIHSPVFSDTDQPLPSCKDCHHSHTISRVDQDDFRTELFKTCGRCHESLTESYFETYHGKASKLGDTVAAKCNDCHGSHNILPNYNPLSTLHRNNIIETCRACHPHSNRQFTGYLTHATHYDKDKYPILFYSFIFMTCLLIGTLTFFGLHTLLWLIRSLIYHYQHKARLKERETLQHQGGKFIRRFRYSQRILHLMVIVSFLSLALTGMTLKFPDVGFLNFVSKILGGPVGTGFIHRISAIITFAYFGIHLFLVFNMWRKREITIKGLFTEEYTMLPTRRDLIELKQNVLWFLGLGKRPKIGRWTYWEKFDYFAVFWGVLIIGSTGLILWFPEFTTLFLPGWIINVATIIHSDEALLAAGFIFTIHFFNTHFRPGIFPMDPVIFTGRVPLEEFKSERPREYQQLLESGKLDDYIVEAPSRLISWLAVLFGMIFLFTGLVIVAAIIYGMVVIY